MIPTKNEELNKYVEELLDKGMIRDSLNPCLVPIMPTPNKD